MRLKEGTRGYSAAHRSHEKSEILKSKPEHRLIYLSATCREMMPAFMESRFFFTDHVGKKQSRGTRHEKVLPCEARGTTSDPGLSAMKGTPAPVR